MTAKEGPQWVGPEVDQPAGRPYRPVGVAGRPPTRSAWGAHDEDGQVSLVRRCHSVPGTVSLLSCPHSPSATYSLALNHEGVLRGVDLKSRPLDSGPRVRIAHRRKGLRRRSRPDPANTTSCLLGGFRVTDLCAPDQGRVRVHTTPPRHGRVVPESPGPATSETEQCRRG